MTQFYALIPRAVPDERFYRSRSYHTQGRRQEPCCAPHHPPAIPANRLRAPAVVLLRSAIQSVEQQIPLLGLLEPTIPAP